MDREGVERRRGDAGKAPGGGEGGGAVPDQLLAHLVGQALHLFVVQVPGDEALLLPAQPLHLAPLDDDVALVFHLGLDVGAVGGGGARQQRRRGQRLDREKVVLRLLQQLVERGAAPGGRDADLAQAGYDSLPLFQQPHLGGDFPFREQAEAAGVGGEAFEGVVLAQLQAVLGARGEEPVGLVHPAGDDVVEQDADVGLVPARHEGLVAARAKHGVDSGHDPLGGRLLVA